MDYVLGSILESGVITLIAVLFTSTWAYKSGRASRQSEIEDLHSLVNYYSNICKSCLKERV